MMANYVRFVFVPSGEFVDQIWMSIYSEEEVQGETGDNQPGSTFFLVRVRGAGLQLSHPPTVNQSLWPQSCSESSTGRPVVSVLPEERITALHTT